MPLFRVTGKFADNHTFSVNPVDGADAKEALGGVLHSQEIREYGSPVVMIAVRSLTGAKKRVRISSEPAKERKGGGRRPAAAAPTPNARPAAPTRR